MNRHIRSAADRFAAAGYSVCAPSLFDRVEPGVELGYGQDDMAAGREYRMKLTEEQVMADIGAAAKGLGLTTIGIVGFCFGGTVAWWAATRTRSFGAASCWYGGGIAGSKDGRPNCPVQMHFGETDQSIPMKDVEAIQMAQAGAEIHVYPGAGPWLRLRRARQLQSDSVRTGPKADTRLLRQASWLRDVRALRQPDPTRRLSRPFPKQNDPHRGDEDKKVENHAAILDVVEVVAELLASVLD